MQLERHASIVLMDTIPAVTVFFLTRPLLL